MTNLDARPIEPLRELRVHIGAHKTATTHLQDQLARSRDRLLCAGIDVIPTDRIRPVGPMRCLRLGLSGISLGDAFPRAIAGLRQGPDTVVVSDEEWIGHIGDAVAARPYGNLGWRLRILSAAAVGARMRLYLAIRPFDRQIPSAYAEALRHGPVRRRPAELERCLLRRPPSWRAIVARVRRAVPRAELTVWEHATYAEDWRAVYERLTGVAPAELDDIPPPERTRTPPAAAVEAAERLGPRLPRRDWALRVAEIYAAATTDPRPYRPWSGAVCQRLEEAYRADLGWLREAGTPPFFVFPPLRSR